MGHKWFVAPWAAMLIGAAVVAVLAFNASTGKVRAAAQNFGPKEAASRCSGAVAPLRM